MGTKVLPASGAQDNFAKEGNNAVKSMRRMLCPAVFRERHPSGCPLLVFNCCAGSRAAANNRGSEAATPAIVQNL